MMKMMVILLLSFQNSFKVYLGKKSNQNLISLSGENLSGV